MGVDMGEAVKRYYRLKMKQKEIEQELGELRNDIIAYCREQGGPEQTIGRYKVKMIEQERREYDDDELFRALPDQGMWRFVSKADPVKIGHLLKLNMMTEEMIRDTYSVRTQVLLQVDKAKR